MKQTDRSVFDGMKREYEEETGNPLPKLKDISRFVYNDHTAIFVAATDYRVSKNIEVKADGEITSIHLSKIVDIKQSIKGHTSFKLRDCTKKSTELLLPYLNK